MVTEGHTFGDSKMSVFLRCFFPGAPIFFALHYSESTLDIMSLHA